MPLSVGPSGVYVFFFKKKSWIKNVIIDFFLLFAFYLIFFIGRIKIAKLAIP